MAKTIFKEKQQFHQPLAYMGLMILMVPAISRFIQLLTEPRLRYEYLGLILAIIAILAFALWYLRHISLHIRLNPKNIKVKVKGLLFERSRKISLDHVREIQFYSVSQASLASGWMVNFSSSSDTSVYDFGDNKLVHILTDEGKSYLLFSKKLFSKKNQLKALCEA